MENTIKENVAQDTRLSFTMSADRYTHTNHTITFGCRGHLKPRYVSTTMPTRVNPPPPPEPDVQ